MIALAIPNVAQAAEGSNTKSKNNCGDVRKGIRYYRDTAWNNEQALGLARSPYAGSENAASCRYVIWAVNRWKERSHSSGRKLRELNGNPRKAICYVFGDYCSQALRVSGCETGHTYHIHAQNGQYLGLFQMGSYARSTYGHGYTALEQSRAAYAYFVNSGRDWSPWSCKP